MIFVTKYLNVAFTPESTPVCAVSQCTVYMGWWQGTHHGPVVDGEDIDVIGMRQQSTPMSDLSDPNLSTPHTHTVNPVMKTTRQGLKTPPTGPTPRLCA